MTTAASKPAKKKAKKSEEIAHLPAPDIRTYSIEAGDPFTLSYYASGKHDYANIVFHVNGTMEYGEYEIRVAKDGRSISFVCAICAKLFNKMILQKIMGEQYHEGHARVIAWGDTVQEMAGKKVYPQNGLYWGSPQVAHLKWKCTGTSITTSKYQTLYRVKIRGEWHVQCDCIVLENCVANELEVKSGYVDLFGVDNSQSQDDPPTPPPHRRKRKSEERHEVDNKNESDNDNGGGGKRGGGYTNSGRGGGKRKSAY
jgi:hypothetical protein